MPTSSNNKYAILIVAAGASKRLGQPKQLLSYKGTTLLNHTLNECWESNIGTIHLILGSNYQSIVKTVDQSKCSILHFEGWEAGMGSSIAFGINNIKNQNHEGIILCLGDQPFISAKLLQSLIKKVELSNSKIVVSKYDLGQGPPVYFAKTLFDQLTKLEGDEGAKEVVQGHLKKLGFVSFSKGQIDIDTIEDLKWLK